MTKTKKIFGRATFGALVLVGCTRWAKVTFQPLYSDVRFQPADQLHAGCSNSADVLFSPQGQKITKFRLVLYYNPESLEILRILPTVDNNTATSKIEYDKIILEVTSPKFDSSTATKSFFQIYFKSETASKQTIRLWTGSRSETATKTYNLTDTFTLDFAEVPECEPDIIPPSINLIHPKSTEERITLDQHFIFDIKDIGKGVDKNSVMISFDGQQYFQWADNLKWNGNYLTFYPGTWIPIDKSMDLKIMITDNQSYGWANKTESIYTFQSATGMALNKEIGPMMFRRIAQEAEQIGASIDECELLANLYTKADLGYQKGLKSIIQKLGCSLTSLDTSLLEANEEDEETNTEQQPHRNISVFGTLGWILFFIVFALKMYYLLSYKKHKKLNNKKRTPQK